MKTFYIVSKRDELSSKIRHKVSKFLINNGFEQVQERPDLVITIGGDGTILKAINIYKDNLDTTAFAGIHTGTLGFYADFVVEEVDTLLKKIVAQDYELMRFNMIEVNVFSTSNQKTYYALNEARIENNLRTQVFEVFIDDINFETFRGNGLNFATPTGSTGYNKSLGGAVIHPKTKALQMCEIASINNMKYRTLASPLVLDQSHIVTLKSDNFKNVILGIDSRYVVMAREHFDVSKITFQLSNKTVAFARYKKLVFLNRVKKNFIN